MKNLKLVQKNIAIGINKQSLFSSSNLWCDKDFKDWVYPKISEDVPGFTGTLSSFSLTENMNDSEIRAELGKGTITPDDFAAILGDILQKQPDGKGDTYEDSGYSNIFYIRLKDCVVAVSVYWDSDDRRWGVRAWRLGGSGWDAGGRVFSRN